MRPAKLLSPISDRPMNRIFPSRTRSDNAPVESSTGTFGPLVQVIEINHIRTQTFQARLTGGLDRLWPPINYALAIPEGQHAFAGEENSFAACPAPRRSVPRFAQPRRSLRCRESRSRYPVHAKAGASHAFINGRAIGMRDVHAAKADGVHIAVADAALGNAHQIRPGP